MTLTANEFNRRAEQAMVLQQAGALDEAQALYVQLLTEDPKNSGLMINLAGVHSARGEIETALALLEQSLAIQPGEAYAHAARGHALMQLGRQVEAEQSYSDAITRKGNVAMFHTSRGKARYPAQPELALADHARAIQLQPDYAEAHNNHGNVLANIKRQAEALASYERACALQPDNPIFWCNRGAMLHFFKRNDEALACYSQAIQRQPNYVEAYINRGTLLGDMRRPADAISDFDRAIALDENATEAYWNKSLLLLMLGDFAQGWHLFESRWQKPIFRKEQAHYPQPLWLGESPIAGKTILIHPEQGFGDYIQFARYAKLIEAQGGTVILEAPPALVTLLKTLSPTITVVAKGDVLPPFDLHCPVMSLPLALDTTLEKIPYAEGFLVTDVAKVEAWEKKLGAKTKKRIGIVWSGAATHINDHNRSIPLAQLASLWDAPCEFYSLQKEVRERDRGELHHLQVLLDDSHDFTDTAALIAALDLVICVDTAVAHVAGALGKPVWLLVPYVPDFRWLLDREDTPWYTHMRLLRQPQPDDWQSVIARVKEMLMDKPAAQPNVSPAMLDQAFQQALAAHQAGELEKAEHLYKLVLSAKPDHLNALGNLSTLYLAINNFEPALLLIEKALAIDANMPALHYNYGKILMRVKLPEEALRRYDRAIALAPKIAEFHSSRGVALYELTRYDEAIESYDRAIALDASAAEFYNNRANALGHVARFEEAIVDYGEAIKRHPDMADAHFNRGLLQLMYGDLEQGLNAYEWRWKRADFLREVRNYPQPFWLGETSIKDKTIFVYYEQGLGDSVQLCRYIPLLEELGAKVILEVQTPLVDLISTVSKTARTIAKGAEPGAFDVHCPIMSLQLAFYKLGQMIPDRIPYLFVPQEKRALWQGKLGPKARPRIGLVWSGSTTHMNDHNRSLALAAVAPLFVLPFEFHSLQKEVRESDQALMHHLVDHRSELNNFTDTAALAEAMDVVISVDTSVAHVAGAIGRPLWMLLPNPPDYRWLLEREDTPWYPQARLFRQPVTRDWASVIAKVKEALAAKFA